MSNLESGSLVGRYRIVRFLGAGAMGEVYLAEDPHIERPLAIKTVRLAGRPQELEDRKRRLLREARAAGRLLHPNVVTLFDAGEQDGLLFLAFEFVEGSDLASRLETQGALSLGDVLKVIRQSAEALDYAHRQGIVHRDIKPSNILIDTAGRVKVADFGIAKMSGQSTELTIAGSVMGSPQYLSPEQIRGEDLDGRSDIFSLGVVLYELLSARRPFDGDSITTLVYQILHKEPPSISELRSVPPRLEELLRRMLAKDRDERLAVAGEVAKEVAAIERELPDETLAAPADRLDQTYVLPKRSSGTTNPHPGPGLPPLPSMPGSPVPSPSTKVSQAPRQEERTAALPPLPPPLPYPGPPSVPTPVSPVVMPAQGMSPIREGRSWTPLVVLGIAAVLVVALSAALGWRWVSGRLNPAAESAATSTAAPGTSAPAQVSGPPLVNPATVPPSPGSQISEADPAEPPAATPPGVTEEPEEPRAAGTEPVRPARPQETPQERPQEKPAPSSRTPTPVPSQPTSQPVPQPPRQEAPRREVPRPAPVETPREEPAMPATVAPEPEPEEAEPAPSSSSRSFQADNVVKTGLALAFRVNPSDAFILVDGKVIGRADEWSGQKRSRSYSLPGPGTYEVKIRKEGLREHRIAIEAGASGGITPVFARLQPLASSSEGSADAAAGEVKVYRVSEAVAFRLRAPAARLLVDGQPVGLAKEYSGGMGRDGWLRLPEGRHRISIVASGFRRQDFIVEVFPGAPQQRERISVDLTPGGDQ